MKIQIVLTVILFIVLFWAGVHFAEKRQKDRHELYDLKEKYAGNYDSLYLSDMQVFYNNQQLKLKNSYANWTKIFGRCTDSSLMTLNFSHVIPEPLLVDRTDSLFRLAVMYLYDRPAFRIRLPKENLLIEAYQQYGDYAKKFPKSYLHSRHMYEGGGTRRSSRLTTNTMIMYNKDTLSDIKGIAIVFSDGQTMQLTVLSKTGETVAKLP